MLSSLLVYSGAAVSKTAGVQSQRKVVFSSAADFADQHLFLYSKREEMEAWTYYKTVLVPAGVTPKRISHMQLTEGIIEMVKAGLGIAVLAHWAVDPEIKRHTIKALPITRKGYTRQWCAATLKNGPMPAYMEAFIKLLANTKMPAMKYY